MLTESHKEEAESLSSFLNQDSFCQLIVDVISSVLDGDGTTASSAGDDRDRFAAVAAEREEEGVELFVIRIDLFDDIFLSFDCVPECHIFTVCIR